MRTLCTFVVDQYRSAYDLSFGQNMNLKFKIFILFFVSISILNACDFVDKNKKQGYLSFASEPNPEEFGYSIIRDNGDNQFLPVMSLANSFTEFSWSLDGKQVAIVKYQNVSKCDIVVIDLENMEEMNLTSGLSECNENPVWSYDGKYIAFSSLTGGHNEIFTIKSDGTELKQLTKMELCSSGNPTWSPDGKVIAFASTCIDGETYNSLYRIDIDGSNLTRLTNNKGADITPKWAPDGRKIMFVSTRDGNNEIYLMNPDGSDQVNITNSLWWEHEPAWSLDGKKIAFESVREGDPSRSFRLQGYKPEIYVMNVDGSEILQITDNDVFDVNPEWKP